MCGARRPCSRRRSSPSAPVAATPPPTRSSSSVCRAPARRCWSRSCPATPRSRARWSCRTYLDRAGPGRAARPVVRCRITRRSSPASIRTSSAPSASATWHRPASSARPAGRSSSTRCRTTCAHVGLIHLILPNARIIDARRHPLACCFSNFKQHFARGQQFTYGLEDIGRYYRDYVELMAHFDAALPGRVHRVFYERMVDDTEAEVRRLLDYCGLPFEDALPAFSRERPRRHAPRVPSRCASRSTGKASITGGTSSRGSSRSKRALGPVLDAYPAVPPFSRPSPTLSHDPRAQEDRTMQRSRKRKLRRQRAPCSGACRWPPRCSQCHVGGLRAAGAAPNQLEEIVVTAQKRTESLQDVPLSIQALGTEKLDELARVQISPTTRSSCPACRSRTAGRTAAPAFRASTCAASPAAATATTRARSRASAPTSTNSRSRRSRARSTSTSTTSSASRCWPVRRARSTAPARRPARSASSPTSRIRPASRPATTSRPARCPPGGDGYLAEGFVNLPMSDNAAMRLVGWYRQGRAASSTTCRAL